MFGAPGPFELTIFVLVCLLAGSIIWRARARGQTLVLRRFELRSHPQQVQVPVVEIVGRSPGIIAFLLSIMGLNDQTTVTVNTLQVECQSASLFGQITTIIPLSRVASVTAGVRKPVGYLIAASLLLLGGFVGSVYTRGFGILAIAVVLAAALTLAYFISKKVLLQVSSNAGPEIMLQFRPSVIEGMPVDVNKALAAVGVIRDLLLRRDLEMAGDQTQVASRPSAPAHSQTFAAAQENAVPPPLPLEQQVASPHPVPAPASELEQAARRLLSEAARLYKEGNRDDALTILRNIVKRYPSTSAAKTAHANLEKLAHDESNRLR